MAKTARLGRADHEKFTPTTGDGDPAEPSHAVFLLASQGSDRTIVPIGTGFFVAQHGIFVTAGHIVDAVTKPEGDAHAAFGLFHLLPGNSYYLRPVHRATRHRVADVAVGVAAPMHHKVTGEPLRNAVLPLASQPPEVGTEAHTFAYPLTRIEPGRPQKVHLEPGFYEGRVEAHFPNGRDAAMLPAACFQTSAVTHGGASGGPVMQPDGGVFAVNSTGYEDDGLSFCSCVSAALDLAIPDVVLPGSPAPRTTTLRELRELGLLHSGPE